MAKKRDDSRSTKTGRAKDSRAAIEMKARKNKDKDNNEEQNDYNLPKRFRTFYQQEMLEYKKYLEIAEKYNNLNSALQGLETAYKQDIITLDEKEELEEFTKKVFEKYSDKGNVIAWDTEQLMLDVKKNALVSVMAKVKAELADQNMTMIDYVVNALQPKVMVTPPSSTRGKKPIIMQQYLKELQEQRIEQQSSPGFQDAKARIKNLAKYIIVPNPLKEAEPSSASELESFRNIIQFVHELTDRLTKYFMRNGMEAKGTNFSVPPRALAEEIVLSDYSPELRDKYSLFSKSLTQYKNAFNEITNGKFRDDEAYKLKFMQIVYTNLMNAYQENFFPEGKISDEIDVRQWQDDILPTLLEDEFNVLRPQKALLQSETSKKCATELEKFRDTFLSAKQKKGGLQLSSFFIPGRLVNRERKAEHTIGLFNAAISAIKAEPDPKRLANALIILQKHNQYPGDYHDRSKSADDFLRKFVSEVIGEMERDQLLPPRRPASRNRSS